jgi:hypothetical protein
VTSSARSYGVWFRYFKLEVRLIGQANLVGDAFVSFVREQDSDAMEVLRFHGTQERSVALESVT